jgi:hypothetical protein
MWTYEHSVDSTAAPGKIFELFRDVDRWPQWNAGVQRIDLHGPFATGTKGTMTMPGDAALSFRLIQVQQGRGFEDETPIPDTQLVVRVRHWLEQLPGGGTRITYSAAVDGPDSDTLGAEIGSGVTADFPQVMTALARLAESE